MAGPVDMLNKSSPANEITADPNRTPVGFKDLPDNLVKALVATEDERFLSHTGIDLRGLARAILFMGSRGGASTLTQQLAKQFFIKRFIKFSACLLYSKLNLKLEYTALKIRALQS
mgnify:CR=1 FL=1